MRVRELARQTRSLDAAALAQRIGPFALMQRPPPLSLVKEGLASRGQATAPLAELLKPPPLLDFSELEVATLPRATPRGEVRLVIGRSPGCDLVINDPSVSGQHAAIHWNGKEGVLIELGSSNGTFVNEKQITGQWHLRDGDELAFANSRFTFLLVPALYLRLQQALQLP